MHHRPSVSGEAGEAGEAGTSESVTGGGWGGVELYIRVLYHSDVSESCVLVLYLMKRVYFDPCGPVLSLTLFVSQRKKKQIKSLFI